MPRMAYATALAVSFTIAGCARQAASPPPPPPPAQVGGVFVYTDDAALAANDLTKVRPQDLINALDPGAEKLTPFVKSGYEKKADFETRIKTVTGGEHRYVLVMPALLQYDADKQAASFCPKEEISLRPTCVYTYSAKDRVNLGGFAAGKFSGGWTLNIAANKLKAPLIPFEVSVPPEDARRAETSGTARIAFVFTLDQPFPDGRFARTTTVNLYDADSQAKVTLRRVVTFEQGGKVLGGQNF